MSNATDGVLYVGNGPAIPSPESFVRRFYGTVAVIKDHVYLVGGLVARQTDDGTTELYPVDQTLSISLKESWDSAEAPIRTVGKAPLSGFAAGTTLPDESKGAFYMIGASDFRTPQFIQEKPQFMTSNFPYMMRSDLAQPQTMLTFTADDEGAGEWSSKPIGDPIGEKLVGGSSAVMNDVGYYFGPRDLALNDQGLFNIYPSMLTYNFISEAWGNVTKPEAPAIEDDMLVPLPDYGEKGLLLSVGGISGTGDRVSFSNITIYDPSTESYHWQKATGDVPKKFSLISGEPLTDESGAITDIFVITGAHSQQLAAGNPVKWFSDIYILSIPAFRWTHVGQMSQRAMELCTRLGSSQILVMGGLYNPNSEISNLEKKDPFPQGLGIFDMTSLKFTNHYDAHRTEPYSSPEKIGQFYQKNRFSNMSWSSPEVGSLFHRTSTGKTAFHTITPEASSDSDHTPAIVGGVVGGIVGLCLLLAAFLFFYRRRRPHASKDSEAQRHTSSSPKPSGNSTSTAADHSDSHDSPGRWEKAELADTELPRPQLPDNQVVPPQPPTLNVPTATGGATGTAGNDLVSPLTPGFLPPLTPLAPLTPIHPNMPQQLPLQSSQQQQPRPEAELSDDAQRNELEQDPGHAEMDAEEAARYELENSTVDLEAKAMAMGLRGEQTEMLRKQAERQGQPQYQWEEVFELPA